MANVRKVGGRPKYINYKDREPGDLIVLGKYLGRTKNLDKYGHKGFLVRDIAGGPMNQLNYSGHLNYLMEASEGRPEVGEAVKIWYSEHTTLESGQYEGSQSHSFLMVTGDEPSDLVDVTFEEALEGDVEGEELADEDDLNEVVEDPAPKKAQKVAAKKKVAKKKTKARTRTNGSAVSMADLD